MEKTIRRTMKGMSMIERDNRRKMEFMVPLDITGRYQLLTKLKDINIDVGEVVVKPVTHLPSVIRKIQPFFSSDGYWNGNFVAYGTSTLDKEVLLWDDVLVEEMSHYDTMVDTQYIKERLDCNKPATLIVFKRCGEKNLLEFYCYLPQ